MVKNSRTVLSTWVTVLSADDVWWPSQSRQLWQCSWLPSCSFFCGTLISDDNESAKSTREMLLRNDLCSPHMLSFYFVILITKRLLGYWWLFTFLLQIAFCAIPHFSSRHSPHAGGIKGHWGEASIILTRFMSLLLLMVIIGKAA